jgi:hypothetical protein
MCSDAEGVVSYKNLAKVAPFVSLAHPILKQETRQAKGEVNILNPDSHNWTFSVISEFNNSQKIIANDKLKSQRALLLFFYKKKALYLLILSFTQNETRISARCIGALIHCVASPPKSLQSKSQLRTNK